MSLSARELRMLAASVLPVEPARSLRPTCLSNAMPKLALSFALSSSEFMPASTASSAAPTMFLSLSAPASKVSCRIRFSAAMKSGSRFAHSEIVCRLTPTASAVAVTVSPLARSKIACSWAAVRLFGSSASLRFAMSHTPKPSSCVGLCQTCAGAPG